MGFWIFMLCMNLLVPAVMLFAGKHFSATPPGKINNVYGYRTKRSKQNQETWEFAHRTFGVLWQRLGWAVLAVSVGVMLPVMGRGTETVSMVGTALCLVQCVVLVASIWPVERALAREFDENGRRRQK